jgi:hypothetical protein
MESFIPNFVSPAIAGFSVMGRDSFLILRSLIRPGLLWRAKIDSPPVIVSIEVCLFVA